VSVGTAKASWWPLHHTWLMSDFNVGFWTDRGEAWYQQWLAEIKAGTAQPLSIEEWRTKLRVNGPTRCFKILSEKVANNVC
jgi:hypothetical protein